MYSCCAYRPRRQQRRRGRLDVVAHASEGLSFFVASSLFPPLLPLLSAAPMKKVGKGGGEGGGLTGYLLVLCLAACLWRVRRASATLLRREGTLTPEGEEPVDCESLENHR